MEASKELVEISDWLNNSLDAIQRHTLVTASFFLLLITATYSNYELTVSSIKIPEFAVFYLAYGIALFCYWNLFRLSKKIFDLIVFKKTKTGLSQDEVNAVYLHHWILSPFNNVESKKISLVDCLPVSLVIYSSTEIFTYLIGYFNNSSILEIWSQFLIHEFKVAIVWGLCFLLMWYAVFFAVVIAKISEELGQNGVRVLEKFLFWFLLFGLAKTFISPDNSSFFGF